MTSGCCYAGPDSSIRIGQPGLHPECQIDHCHPDAAAVSSPGDQRKPAAGSAAGLSIAVSGS